MKQIFWVRIMSSKLYTPEGRAFYVDKNHLPASGSVLSKTFMPLIAHLF